ncbi:hypothetical protein [Marinilactibacillus sp. Marseille-P9653]|uniref:hypothetical protein n=1 Tax=Marinilactibacillus sp. Marseille-P9653 TaxID=2866583 RepID=UPI001CE3DE52|nr:hypothetical protein [Marinilactibacillus sp. Marseille-P9653]
MSNRDYTEMVEKYNEMEETLFFSRLINRVEEGPKKIIAADDVLEKFNDENPFAHLSEEELFD